MVVIRKMIHNSQKLYNFWDNPVPIKIRKLPISKSKKVIIILTDNLQSLYWEIKCAAQNSKTYTIPVA